MKENRKLLTGILIGALLASVSVFLYMKNLHESRFENQQLLISQQAELADSIRNSGLPGLVSAVLNKIDADLKDNPKRRLSDETIASISTMCYIAKPYLIPEGDSLSTTKLSPERGQLLLFLSGMNIDSGSMQKIKQSASFSGADLREADLSGIDLSRMNLKGANLKGANLQNANMTAAILSFANLWGANLNKAKLTGADLKRAELSWSELNNADLKNADLGEANVISAQLRNADLQSAILKWTDFNGAFLNEANLASSDLFRATFKRAQMAKANLTNANLTLANLVEANLTETNFTDAELSDVVVFEENWLELLNDWNIIGAKDIVKSYKIIDETSTGKHLYQLKKIVH